MDSKIQMVYLSGANLPVFTTPNGIRIQSAVLPQYTFRTDKQTDRQMGSGVNYVPRALTLTLYMAYSLRIAVIFIRVCQ